MKNDKIRTLLILGLACLGMASCGDFLDIEPRTFVSEKNFWNEKTDVDQMVMGTYTKMQSADLIARCIVWGETRGDNVQDGLNCERDNKDLYRVLQEQLLETNPYANWQAFYAVINQCNTIIQHAPEVSEKDPVYIESDMRATQAELAFLRDLCYFYLVRAFKDVPYYTYAIESDEEAQPIAVSRGDSIIDCLIADLDAMAPYALKAYPKLDETNDGTGKMYNSNCNRVTQNSIYALLADLCLWKGDYRRCVDYAQKVIDAKLQEYNEDFASKSDDITSASITSEGNILTWGNNVKLFICPLTGQGYPLIPCFSSASSLSSESYGADFNSLFGGNGNSFESIFELAFTKEGENDSYISNKSCALLYGNHYADDGDVAKNGGQGYLAVADELYTIASSTPTASDVFTTRYDSRFYNSFVPEKTDEYTNAYISKFVNTGMSVTPLASKELPYSAKESYSTYKYCTRNWVFYRLTDVMLMQAEALIEGEPTEEDLRQAFGLIYAVNRRSILAQTTASNTTVNTYELKFTDDNTTQDGLRELCKKERRRELLFEGKRWFDLLRYYRRDGRLEQIPQRKIAEKITDPEKLYWPYYVYDLKNNELMQQKDVYKQE